MVNIVEGHVFTYGSSVISRILDLDITTNNWGFGCRSDMLGDSD
jgi:hypothetical protein